MNYFVVYSVYVLILSVLMGISTWKLFKKMGYNPIFSFVPFYNYFIILKETKKPRWWVVFSYFPIVGTVMMSVFHLFLMKKFGKKLIHNQLLTVLLPFVYMAVVNYSKHTEIETENEFYFAGEQQEERKESFLGSITFAVVFATIIHTFITQPFAIPTGSMERTLLVGDFLFVNKLNYGYRMPMRPLAIPFLQGTILDTGKKNNPKDDPKSYADAVALPYFRLPGWEKPKRNEIVVFNYPQDSVHNAIDRKDPYVKRLIGEPGDVIEMRAGRLYVNGKPEQKMPDAEVQHAYSVVTSTALDINALYKVYGFLPVVEKEIVDINNNITGYVYHFQGLTDKVASEIKQMPEVLKTEEDIISKGFSELQYYPLTDEQGSTYVDENGRAVLSKKIDVSNCIFPINKKWNQDWYGPIQIPKKGEVVKLTSDNLPKYRWIISRYENNQLEEKDGQIYINGTQTNEYTVKYDYYMMIGDNRDASLDSRFFGFVPETHIVGKPMFTWMSIEGLFPASGSSYQAQGWKIRWDRMFKKTNTGEVEKTSYWWLALIVLILFFGWDFFAKWFKKKKENE